MEKKTEQLFASINPCTLMMSIVIIAELNLQGYLSTLPAGARPHLELEVEWGDIVDIAHHMLGWLCSHLGLTQVDLHDIKVIHKDNPLLQR